MVFERRVYYQVRGEESWRLALRSQHVFDLSHEQFH